MPFLIPVPGVLHLSAPVDGQRQKWVQWRKRLSCREAVPGHPSPWGRTWGSRTWGSAQPCCWSSSVLTVRQRCSAGLVGQLVLNEIIMDKYMKRLAKVSCLFYNWWTQVFRMCRHILFVPCVGHMFFRTSSMPWFLWLVVVSETEFEAVWSIGWILSAVLTDKVFICWKKNPV